MIWWKDNVAAIGRKDEELAIVASTLHSTSAASIKRKEGDFV
jgi:hypothetical protein